MILGFRHGKCPFMQMAMLQGPSKVSINTKLVIFLSYNYLSKQILAVGYIQNYHNKSAAAQNASICAIHITN